MKTLSLSLVLVMLTFGVSMAKPLPFPEPENRLPDNVKNQIINQLNYAQFVQSKAIEGEVFVQLKVTADKKLELVAINASNDQLREYVAQALANGTIKLKKALPATDYCLKLAFINK